MSQLLLRIKNEKNDSILVYNDHIELKILKMSFLKRNFTNWITRDAHKEGYEAYINFDNMIVHCHKAGIMEACSYMQFDTQARRMPDNYICFKNPSIMNDIKRKIMKIKTNYEKVTLEQTIVHGDQVTKTEIKDSVLNRSNVGGGSSKMQELEKLAEMKEKSLIDDDEFKQMKKEILGK